MANDTRKRDVTAVAMFSHFINIVWIVLLFALYFSNFSFDGL